MFRQLTQASNYLCSLVTLGLMSSAPFICSRAADETDCLRAARELPGRIRSINYEFTLPGLERTHRFVWENGRFCRQFKLNDQVTGQYMFDGNRYEMYMDGTYMMSYEKFGTFGHMPELELHMGIFPYMWFWEDPTNASLVSLQDQKKWSEVILRMQFLRKELHEGRECEVYSIEYPEAAYQIWFSTPDHGYPVKFSFQHKKRDLSGEISVQKMVAFDGPIVIATTLVADNSAREMSPNTLRVNEPVDFQKLAFRPEFRLPALRARVQEAVDYAADARGRCMVAIADSSLITISDNTPNHAMVKNSAVTKLRAQFRGLVLVYVTPELVSLNRELDYTYLAERNWQSPRSGSLQLIALDDNGAELARLDTTPKEVEDEAARIADYINHVSLPKLDAQKNWEDALKLASDTQRKVWVYIGGVGCGPCIRLGRWLDEHRSLIELDYVVLKIDNEQDIHGKAITSQLRAGVKSSIPYHAIFNFVGDKLVDSIGPDGNIGFPSDSTGIEHFTRMIRSTAENLSGSEIESLIESLNES